MRRRLLFVPIAVLLTACGSIPGTPSRALTWSVAEALSWIPASAITSPDALIVTGDLDTATALAGATRPSNGADADAIRDWLLDINFRRPEGDQAWISCPLPDTAGARDADPEAVEDELGWNVRDVRAFAEVIAPPDNFAVFSGEFAAARLTAAMGNAQQEVWRIGPDEDGAIDVANATAARRLGESLRTGLAGDMLAVSERTGPVTDWLSGSNRLSADPALTAMATALDGSGLYGAYLVPDASELTSAAGDEPDQLPDAFDAVAIGIGVRDDATLLVFVYSFADANAAAANVDRIRTVATEGESFLDRRQWSERIEVHDVVANGSLVVLTATQRPDTGGNFALNVLLGRDSLVLHR